MSTTMTPESLVAPGTLQESPLPTTVVALTKSPEKGSRWPFVVLAFAALAAVCWALTSFVDDSGFSPGSGNSPVDGMTIFAVFFVSATAIERLLEPVSIWLVPKDDAKKEADESKGKAKVAVAQAQGKASDSAQAITAKDSIGDAAQKKANLAEKEWQRSVVMWTIASIVGMAVAASFKLYFLGTVGIAYASRWQEILATGLIIGAGTKHLHDLTELLGAKKEAAEAKT